MTEAEIGESTPWEIQKRIEGYGVRAKGRRMFTASFLTAPIINAGVRSPKHPVTPSKLLPEDFHYTESQEEREEWMAIAKAEEERRVRLKNERTADHSNTGS